MALGRRPRKASSKAPGRESYDDVEGITISIGIIFAILLPAMLELQGQAFDEGVLSKNFQLLICTQPKFRSYVVEILTDESFGFNLSMGDVSFDTKAVLGASSDVWRWDGGSNEAIYPCQTEMSIATTTHYVFQSFPHWMMDTWALLHPEAPLWTDAVNGMCSFGMVMMMGGLQGSMVLYISLSLSAGREDSSGKSLARWCKVGLPLLGCGLVLLIAAIIVLLFANDAYTESQDVFWLRNGRWAGYSKIALLGVFAPILIIYIVTSLLAFRRSTRAWKRAEEPAQQVPEPGPSSLVAA